MRGFAFIHTWPWIIEFIQTVISLRQKQLPLYGGGIKTNFLNSKTRSRYRPLNARLAI